MCFHTSLTKEEKALEERFMIHADYSMGVYEPYNHRSGFDKDFIYIIKDEEPYNFFPAYWGLMPEDYNIYQRTGFLKKTNTLNARAEGLFESPLFEKPTLENRCLILADGFFEPHTRNGKSFPHYIRYKNKGAFAFAGIYTELDDGLYTASIITTLANPYFKEIHNKPNRLNEYRMPLVLDESNEADWIDGSLNKNQIMELLFTFTNEDFESYTVSKDVMNSHVDSNRPDILQPVLYDELNTLF
ncbi:SOS response-associated peptidase [Flavobacteriaceae bacterium S0825]|uniref:SOS response-associated peptidase n=1 Tax=Gaetbulibacter sp. S0825 TaxID=2720084 RepID=UPI0014308422|nr:SOS response-associated peptidase [Gaetbulibacter sp. S0825]MCK0109542.1 SOS response-associated peptidase [Flavobacteriaceae bacterium S0825]NIX65175.1 SOS response-associated peptidase [Gaetbulibacter sp. S0825]